MNPIVKMYHYCLAYDCDADSIWDEAQQYDCNLTFGAIGRATISMWETNPYNSLFVLKYDKEVIAIKQESWIL